MNTNLTIALPITLARDLLGRPNTTLIAAIPQLTPDLSNSLYSLPKHATSTVIPAKIDLGSQYDAVGIVRVLTFSGVTRVDAVVVSDYHATTAGSSGQYADGVLNVFRQFRTLLAEEARFAILGRGSGCPEGGKSMIDSIVAEDGGVIPFFVDWYVFFFFSVFQMGLTNLNSRDIPEDKQAGKILQLVSEYMYAVTE